MKGGTQRRSPKQSKFNPAALLAMLSAGLGESSYVPRNSSFLGRAMPRMSSSRYMPHQGPRECARRVRQMKAGTHGYPTRQQRVKDMLDT